MGDDAAEDGESDSSRAELEQQRDDVRATAVRVIAAVEDELPGSRRPAQGRYQGCRSAGVDTFASFQYRLSVRIDGPEIAGTPAAGADRASLPQLGTRLAQEGFNFGAASTGSEGQALQGTSARETGIAIKVTDRPQVGDFVLLELSGPCIDVPPDDSDLWLRHSEDEPLPG
ncbi:MAG: hypothetical protein WB767_18145 [Nocardioides sp.]